MSNKDWQQQIKFNEDVLNDFQDDFGFAYEHSSLQDFAAVDPYMLQTKIINPHDIMRRTCNGEMVFDVDELKEQLLSSFPIGQYDEGSLELLCHGTANEMLNFLNEDGAGAFGPFPMFDELPAGMEHNPRAGFIVPLYTKASLPQFAKGIAAHSSEDTYDIMTDVFNDEMLQYAVLSHEMGHIFDNYRNGYEHNIKDPYVLNQSESAADTFMVFAMTRKYGEKGLEFSKTWRDLRTLSGLNGSLGYYTSPCMNKAIEVVENIDCDISELHDVSPEWIAQLTHDTLDSSLPTREEFNQWKLAREVVNRMTGEAFEKGDVTILRSLRDNMNHIPFGREVVQAGIDLDKVFKRENAPSVEELRSRYGLVQRDGGIKINPGQDNEIQQDDDLAISAAE